MIVYCLLAMTDSPSSNASAALEPWPSLPLNEWQDTYATLHMWTQIVGKIRLHQAPWVNHSWHVSRYVTSRGLTTSPIPFGNRTCQIDFDFIDHRLLISVSDGGLARMAYSHEVSSCGFWPGGGPVPYPVFYSYSYPEPAGFGTAPMRPDKAIYESSLHEFILPYDEVRRAPSPDALLLEFLQSSYEAAARLGKWHRSALERKEPIKTSGAR